MKGSIQTKQRQKGTVYRASIDLPQDPDGSRNRKTKSFQSWKYEDAEEAAREWLILWNYRISSGEFLPNLDVTVESYLSSWNQWTDELAPKTIEKREWAIEQHIVPALGKNPLQDLSPFQIRRFLSIKRESLEPSSVQILFDVFSMAVEDAVSEGILDDNPFDSVDRPSRNSPSFYVFSKPEKQAFFRGLQEATKYFSDTLAGHHPHWHHFYAPFITLFETGMRLGELLGLQEDDLNLQESYVDVKRQLKKDDGEWYFDDLKSSSSRRRIGLTSTNRNVIWNYLDIKRDIEGTRFDWIGAPVLFVSRRGNYITRSSLRRSFKKALDRADLGDQDIRLHDIRHTHASQFLQIEGVTVEDVRDRLGHSRCRTLLDYYVHATSKTRDEAVKKFEEQFAI